MNVLVRWKIKQVLFPGQVRRSLFTVPLELGKLFAPARTGTGTGTYPVLKLTIGTDTQ
jgi:hypothetical protein